MSHPNEGRPAATSRLRRTPGVVIEELDGQLLLLAPGHAHVLLLDEVASHVWQLLETAPTADELADALAERYGVPVDQVPADLSPALEALGAHGLLT